MQMQDSTGNVAFQELRLSKESLLDWYKEQAVPPKEQAVPPKKRPRPEENESSSANKPLTESSPDPPKAKAKAKGKQKPKSKLQCDQPKVLNYLPESDKASVTSKLTKGTAIAMKFPEKRPDASSQFDCLGYYKGVISEVVKNKGKITRIEVHFDDDEVHDLLPRHFEHTMEGVVYVACPLMRC